MPLIVEHHEELEASLLPHHDLLDFWRGRMTPRRLALLIHHLPAGCPFFRAINPDAAFIASWDPSTYVLAEVWDLLLAINWDSKKNGKPPSYLRPADQVRQRDVKKPRLAAMEAMVTRNQERQRQIERG